MPFYSLNSIPCDRNLVSGANADRPNYFIDQPILLVDDTDGILKPPRSSPSVTFSQVVGVGLGILGGVQTFAEIFVTDVVPWQEKVCFRDRFALGFCHTSLSVLTRHQIPRTQQQLLVEPPLPADCLKSPSVGCGLSASPAEALEVVSL